MKRTSFCVLILKGLLGLHRTVNFSFLSSTGQGIDLDYPDIELFALETNRDHSVVLRLHPNIAFRTLLLTIMATSFLLRDSCPR